MASVFWKTWTEYKWCICSSGPSDMKNILLVITTYPSICFVFCFWLWHINSIWDYQNNHVIGEKYAVKVAIVTDLSLLNIIVSEQALHSLRFYTVFSLRVFWKSKICDRKLCTEEDIIYSIMCFRLKRGAHNQKPQTQWTDNWIQTRVKKKTWILV